MTKNGVCPGFGCGFLPQPGWAGGRRFTMKDLIVEYERLRRLAHELDVQVNTVDARLIEIERQLPDSYHYPGDPPEEKLLWTQVE